jgi:excisionase family DNA binding protein
MKDILENEKLLTKKEAAEFLNVTMKEMVRFMDKRQIPYYKFTRSVRFRRSVLIAYRKRSRGAEFYAVSVAQDKESPTENLITKEQAAEFLNISLGNLREWMTGWIVPYYVIGGLVRFKRSKMLAHFDLYHRVRRTQQLMPNAS